MTYFKSNLPKNYISTIPTQRDFLREERPCNPDVVKDYTYALYTLGSYDFQTLTIKSTTKEQFQATYENVMAVIMELKRKFGESELFGHEKDGSFHSSIGQIYQTWDGIDLYPSVEEPFIFRREQAHHRHVHTGHHYPEPFLAKLAEFPKSLHIIAVKLNSIYILFANNFVYLCFIRHTNHVTDSILFIARPRQGLI